MKCVCPDRAARADGLDAITLIRLIRQVFGLSLVEAKEVKVLAEGLAPSLAAHLFAILGEAIAGYGGAGRDENVASTASQLVF